MNVLDPFTTPTVHLISRSVPRVALAASLIAVAGCSDGAAGPNGSAPFRLAFQLTPAASMASEGSFDTSGAANADVEPGAEGIRITRDGDELLVTKLVLVVRNVHLQTTAGSCETLDDSDEANDDSADDDDCPTVHAGPLRVDVPTTGANAQQLSVTLPAGRYSRVRMFLKAVKSQGNADRDFRAANPDLANVSVLVEGLQDGRSVTFRTDVNAHLEVPLEEPVTLDDEGDQVTVTLDLARWFAAPRGGLYDLSSESASVRAHITNTIRDAFRAFRDRDRNGRKD